MKHGPDDYPIYTEKHVERDNIITTILFVIALITTICCTIAHG